MRRMAHTEFFAILFLVVALVAIVVLPTLQDAERRGPRISCANNLKQMGIVYKMYANEHDGAYPPGSTATGWNPFTVGVEYVYPDYLSPQLRLLYCTDRFFDEKTFEADVGALEAGDPEGRWPELDLGTPEARQLAVAHLAARSTTYAYIPWATIADADFVALEAGLAAYREQECNNALPCGFYVDLDLAALGVETITPSPMTLSDSVSAVLFSGSRKIHRLHEGTGRLILGTADVELRSVQHHIPVMCDNLDDLASRSAPHSAKAHWYQRGQPAANVLYLDGHVERIAFPGKYPVTETVVASGLAGGTRILD